MKRRIPISTARLAARVLDGFRERPAPAVGLAAPVASQSEDGMARESRSLRREAAAR